ncbi:MAG: hypothetical protein PVG32_19905 [Anaerolineales bacterium]|jgi:hypothetical protein
MSGQQGVFQRDTLQRISSAGLVIGAVLLVVFNLLYPRPADPSSAQSVLTAMADQKVLTQLSQLMLALGFWGLMIGSAGVHRSITDRGAAWARLGFYGIVGGTAIWSINFGLGLASANAASDWVVASVADKAAAYDVANTFLTVNSGIYTMSILMFWLALIFLGAGMARNPVYPQWFGWVAVVLGIAMVAIVGIPRFLVENSTSSMFIFAGLSLLTTVWFLVVGIWVARRAW